MDLQFATAFLAGIPMPVVVINDEGRIDSANAPALDMLGEGLVGRLYLTAFRQPALAATIDAALAGKHAGVSRFTQAGGQVFRVTVTPVAQGAICAFDDTSEQEQIGQMRRDFVANVSHELRSPLTALVGFIETLQGAARDDAMARTRFLEIMAREAGRMNRLVGDLLQLSRVEAQERVRPTVSVDLGAVLARVVSDLRPVSDAAQVEVRVSPVAGAMVLGDADQLVQVLTNLVENAIKYGGNGKVVRADLRTEARDPVLRCAAFRIDVSDQGDGIDAVHLPRLTERFYRVDTHRSREKGGTGLGLAIVKHIVSRHRGRLLITSERGVGSTFSVVLPAAETVKID
ncbi:ATP-binding protein [Pseudorhodobacter ferrugineus]|uniref:ATP-binding protein n=1 Tax=Pseudorhodobacter ferrugineus TaxID=77008 RepID=UPI0003B2F880|nr:ATP-binding protein [Pseudorhodobacter ferrugineus]